MIYRSIKKSLLSDFGDVSRRDFDGISFGSPKRLLSGGKSYFGATSRNHF